MKKSGNNIYFFAVATTFTVFVWIVFEVFHNLTFDKPPNIPSNIIAPLNPSLSQKALSELESRIFFSEYKAPIVDTGAGSSLNPSVTPIPSPTPTVEVSPTPTP